MVSKTTDLSFSPFIRTLMLSLAVSGFVLFAFQRTMSPALSAVLLWHIAAGAGLAIPVALSFVRSLKSVRLTFGHKLLVIGGILTWVTGLWMIAVSIMGRGARHFPGFYEIHAAVGIVVSVVAAYRFLRRRNRVRSAPVLASMILLSAGGLGAISYEPDRSFRILTASTPQQAENPLHPAGLKVERWEDWSRTESSQRCGDAGCHPDITARMVDSPHAGWKQNLAVERAMQAEDMDSRRWCEGCHKPASLRPSSGASGIDCISCHAMKEVPVRAGGGHAVISPHETYPFARSENPRLRAIHDFLLRVRPIPHTDSLAGPSRNPSLSCVPCHRNGVTAALNRTGYLLYDDTWGQWQNSPFSGKSLHTFRTESPSRSCVSCHPIHSTSYRSRQEQASALSRAVSVKIFLLTRQTSGADIGLITEGASMVPGEPVSVDVLVQNNGLGHAFPSGSPDLKRAWIEFRVSDDAGRILAFSGRPGAREDSVHRYGMTTLDSAGRRASYGSKSDAAAHLFAPPAGSGQAYTANYRAVGAGEADVARYTFRAPAAEGDLVLDAKLWYSTGEFESAPPRLLGSDSVGIHVRKEPSSRAGKAAGERGAEDWFGYGIALFRQKDAAGARRAFERSRGLKPNEPEHTIAIGRTYLEEGDLLSARSQFENALRMSPDSARARAWHGRTLRIMGQYSEAIDILSPLTKSHPEDAVTWFDLGLCQFRIGDFAAAITSFQQTLSLAPDDSGAHLNLMLAYRRMMRISEARREEAMYLNLKHDGRPAPLIQNYLRYRPDEALEASLRHEHALVLKP